MNVVCLQEEAFYELVEKVYQYVRQLEENKIQDQWISDKEAMRMLRIKSPSTLQNLRDTGAIRYSQPSKKIILYDRNSINEFLEKHVREVF